MFEIGADVRAGQVLYVLDTRPYEAEVERARGALAQATADIAQAEAYQRRSLAAIQEARTSGLPGWRASYATFGQTWESEIEFGSGLVFSKMPSSGMMHCVLASFRLLQNHEGLSQLLNRRDGDGDADECLDY